MQPTKPHWAWFLLGPAILVLGGVAAIVLMVGGLTSITEGMQRVDIPGNSTIRVDQAGRQPVFFEQRGVSQANAPLGLEISIVPKVGGAPVVIEPGFGNVTYNVNGVAGRKWGEADFPAAGEYQVTTSVPLGASGGQLALGGNPGEKIVGSVLGFFGIGIGSFFLCVVVMIVVLIKRMGYRKRMMQQQYAGLSPMPAAPPPGT